MNVFSYIIQLGASVMMPVIFTIIGLCIGMKFGKALKSGLFVGVGFVGLGIVTALLTDNFKDPLKAIESLFNLNLQHGSGCINHPHLSWHQLFDGYHQDNAHG